MRCVVPITVVHCIRLMSDGASLDLKYFSFGTAGKKVLSKYGYKRFFFFFKHIMLLYTLMKFKYNHANSNDPLTILLIFVINNNIRI